MLMRSEVKCSVYIYIYKLLLRYLFNVSPFTLMKGTGVPENYVC